MKLILNFLTNFHNRGKGDFCDVMHELYVSIWIEMVDLDATNFQKN